jgi:Serine-threonine protein kinase 19
MSSNSLGNKHGNHSVKRVGGIKLVVRRKETANSKRKLSSAPSTRGFPKRRQKDDRSDSSVIDHPQTQEETPPAEEDIPCDTLLAMRSLERTSQCLFIPLFVGTVPCVLESQLYHTLRSQNGEDSIVTTELQQLTQTQQVRRLSSPSNLHVEALIERRHYARAVWDAHRHYDKADVTVTSAFLSCLDHVSKRRISQSDLNEHCPNTWKDNMVDTLVQMQVLLPVDNAYMLWLPHWGLVLKELSKGQARVIQQLKRSMYKELSKTQVERIHHTGLSGRFVLHTLVAQGLVELHERPSGTFVRLMISK